MQTRNRALNGIRGRQLFVETKECCAQIYLHIRNAALWKRRVLYIDVEKNMDMVCNIDHVLSTTKYADEYCGCDLCRFDENGRS